MDRRNLDRSHSVTALANRLFPGRARVAFALLLVMAPPAAAQQPRDTARAAVDTVGPRPELRPPLSPRRAFLYSLLLPGYGQSVLGRNRAGALQVAFEAAALVMIRNSASDIREARRNLADSVPVSFVDPEGNPAIIFERTPFSAALLRSRQSHLEDWIAVLIANHIFSGADAFVASLLWDLPAEVSLRATPATPATPGSASLTFNVRW